MNFDKKNYRFFPWIGSNLGRKGHSIDFSPYSDQLLLKKPQARFVPANTQSTAKCPKGASFNAHIHH